MPKARAADAVSPDAAVAEAAAGWIGPQPAVAGPLDGGVFDEQIGWGAEPRVVRCDPAWKQAALARGAEALRQARAERTSDRVVLTADRNPPEEMEPSYFGAKEAEASGDIEISGYLVRQDRILN